MEQTVFPPKGKPFGSLEILLNDLPTPFAAGQTVGVKVHWGERGNHSYLRPEYTKIVIDWLREKGCIPFVFDTTVLYSGGRRRGEDSLRTAAEHNYTEKFLGCPIVIADGMDGRNVVDLESGFKHFKTVQVASLVEKDLGFIIFSHFKGHQAMGFGGAVKNISMGFASRAQKQRIHADVFPELDSSKCTCCGICVATCPSGAATLKDEGCPSYSPKLCVGCAQCIALCPEVALRILWGSELESFQEKLVETAATVWRSIASRTVCINALLSITSHCDCMSGSHPVIAPDFGFVGGIHPVAVDRESLAIVGSAPFEKAHPEVPLHHQFAFAKEIHFWHG